MDNYAKRFKIDCSPVAKNEQTIVRGSTRLTVITPCLLRVENHCSPVADKKQTIINGKTRLTVITPCLLRVEVQKEGKFCDEPTQSVWFRDFCDTKFELKEANGIIEIKTEKVNFVYSLKSKKMQSEKGRATK